MALAALAADDVAGRRWAERRPAPLRRHRRARRARRRQPAAGRADGGPRRPGRRAGRRGGPARLSRPGAADGCEPLDIEADVAGLGADPGHVHRIRGQVAVASTPGRVQRVWLRPAAPPACPEAVAAVRAADVVLLGPGLVVHQRAAAPAGPRPARRAARDVRAAGRGAEPGAGAGGDRRLLARAAPGRTLRARAAICASTRCSPTSTRCPCRSGCTGRPRRCSPGRPGAPGAGRRRRSRSRATTRGARGGAGRGRWPAGTRDSRCDLRRATHGRA